MSDPLLEADDASTPLSAEEREGLIPSYISLRHELNEAEQANILEAEQWAFARKRDVLDERFLTALHKHMFGRVWRWAGKYRLTEHNVGVDPYRIATDLLLVALGQPRFNWGRTSLVTPSETRQAYVAALRAADSSDIRPLLEFVRS